MSGIGTGYDFSTTTFSPEGKIFQVAYAAKAIENSGTCIALRVKDGVVFATEKLFCSKLLVPGSDHRIFAIDRHMGLAASGLVGDIRHVFNRARYEAEVFKENYNMDIPVMTEANRVASYVQLYTLYLVRPFGMAAIVGGVDSNGPQLFMIEPSGISWGYFGVATGKAKQAAKTEIEKLNLSEMDARTAIIEAAKIIYKVHDETKDKYFELEMAWVCSQSDNKFQFIPEQLSKEAQEEAKKAVKEAEEIEEEDDE
ncbi:proteasome subunit alpha type-3-like [Schistocerca gregaria]|uniref:proteasome subunit alpha type-3-like n=1 Tax=Schistocerca gregaria TaxID=7010 RepID=UPI00211F1EF9|nr:proteasome subunit alpha type-3-like [Schistocerca gregaria]